jgi:hypothetical protein
MSPTRDHDRLMRHTLVLTLTALVLAAPATAAHKPKPHEHAKRAHSSKAVARAKFTGTAVGKLTELSSTSLTVRSDDREATCTVGDDSPKLGFFHTGDRVKVSCANGFLTAIANLDAQVETTTAVGVLSARSDASVTISTEKGDVTCRRADASPKLGDLRVGDRVKAACTNGALTAIVKLDPPPVTPSVITGGVGPVTALTTAGLTLHTDAGDMTCRLTGDSRVPVEFHVGDVVKMSCLNGQLIAIAKL